MCISPIRIRHPTIKGEFLDVPCGKCLECAQKRVNDWSFRMIQEMSDKNAYFFTLTYDDENLPIGCFDSVTGKLFLKQRMPYYDWHGLIWKCDPDFNKFPDGVELVDLPCFHKPDLQYFIHALRDDLRRKKVKVKLKYFISSEYGGKTLRPHYHGVIFGFPFDLSTFINLMQKYWKFGFSSASICNQNRIYYTLKYAFKNAVVKPKGLAPFSERCFIMCSKNIGINFLTQETITWMKSNLNIKIHDKNFIRTIPRYYRDKVFDEFEKEQIKNEVWLNFDQFAGCPDSQSPFRWRDENYKRKINKIKNKIDNERM